MVVVLIAVVVVEAVAVLVAVNSVAVTKVFLISRNSVNSSSLCCQEIVSFLVGCPL